MAWKKPRWTFYGPRALVALAVLIQLVPVEPHQPSGHPGPGRSAPGEGDPESFMLRLPFQRDPWPWDSHVAPVSWLVASDVARGRHHFNFSTWDRYDASRRHAILTRGLKAVNRGQMPPWYYTIKHPDGKMTDQKRAVLESWAATF